MLIREIIPATDDEARVYLSRIIADRREDMAGLSRMIGRSAGYLRSYLKLGTPKRLPDRERAELARYFRIDPRHLGAPNDL